MCNEDFILRTQVGYFDTLVNCFFLLNIFLTTLFRSVGETIQQQLKSNREETCNLGIFCKYVSGSLVEAAELSIIC